MVEEVKKLNKRQIELPHQLDVLVHLPSVGVQGDNVVCMAKALQYNLSAIGESPDEALEKITHLVIETCKDAAQMGINPRCLADPSYLAAFALATPMPDMFAHFDARLTAELMMYLDCTSFTVRTIANMQQKLGVYEMDAFVSMA